LQHEDVAADVFCNSTDFAVGEAADIGATQIDIELLCDVGGQFGLALPVKTIRLL
jgi:hypothetical protein